VGWLRYALVAVLCLSNALSVLSSSPLHRWRRINEPNVPFIRGILTPYTDRTEEVVAFVEQHAGPDDTILVMDPEFPLIFYTNRRIVDARLTASVETPPDWVFSESASGSDTYDPLLPPAGIAQLYERIVVPVHKTRRGASRSDPHFHENFSARERSEFVVYRVRDSARARRARQGL
jgi:hypothetical protein